MPRPDALDDSSLERTGETSTTVGIRYVDSLDGIRALSVLAVYLYHVTIPFHRGGFLGVSTFFTLSGFLITSLLVRESTERGGIDVIGFWSRRVRRLAPAALLNIALVLALTVVGWSIWPKDSLGGDTTAVLANVFNWRLISEGSENLARYFTPFSPQWSLAVEEQFYLVFPLLVLVAGFLKAPKPMLVGVFVGAICVSIVVSIWYEPGIEIGLGAAASEQYRTDVRIGEIAAGGLLALWLPNWSLPNRKLAELLGWAGLAATIGLWAFADLDGWWLAHGGLALVAIASAALLIGALADGPLARLLGIAPLAYIGKLSYGIYLFHWPIMLATQDSSLADNRTVLFVFRTVATFGLAALSFHLIESPIRTSKILSGRSGTVAWVTSALLLIGAAFAVGT